MINFYAEQEQSLKIELLELHDSIRHLQDDIFAMHKEVDRLKISTDTVESILDRERCLTDQYSAKIGNEKEAISSAKRYIDNLNDRLIRIDVDKRERNREIAQKHKGLIAAIEAEKAKLAEVQLEIEETQEERDDLWGKFQAKAAIQRQSELESKYR